MPLRLAVSAALALAACGASDPAGEPGNGPPLDRSRVLGPFLEAHWRVPTPRQGPPPEDFTEAEASLAPQVCGSCHPEQYRDWQTSLHAAAYSPGFSGQLIEGSLAKPHQIRHCQTCHAPLAEQQPYDAAHEPEVAFDPELRAGGIVCAACHVRAHRRIGPPRRPELPELTGALPHAGFEARPEFEEARFCAPCHQFFDDEGANGKPLENTWAEWRASPQAAEGRTCQSCHMPDRAHLWRGIHDPEMVRAAVDVDLVATDAGSVAVSLVLRNRDVGHAFPSYVTPRVFLAVWQVDASGAEIAETRVEATIGREVNLSTYEEVFDTRVLPGESVKLDYALARRSQAVALVGRVTVDPDHHYRGVFASLLRSYEDAEARARMAEAHRRASESSYVLAEIRRPLPPGD